MPFGQNGTKWVGQVRKGNVSGMNDDKRKRKEKIKVKGLREAKRRRYQ